MGWTDDLRRWRLERDRRPGARTQRGVAYATAGIVLAMLLLSWIWAASHPKPDPGETGRLVYGVTLFVVFAAAGAIGAALGFLFGLPRARVSEPLTQTSGEGAPTGVTRVVGRNYLANSNLIKVSDWLTTIVIGLTLVNLGKIAPAARRLSGRLEEPLGGSSGAATLGLAVIIFGAVCGFILMYLYVSIRIRELLEDAEDSEVAVPEFVDLDVATAKRLASGLSITLTVPDGTADTATITGQWPDAGTVIGGDRNVYTAV